MLSKAKIPFELSALEKLTNPNSKHTFQVIIVSDDFAKGKRGPVITADPNKVRITIRLDADIVEYFKSQVIQSGGGNYQTLINNALRKSMGTDESTLEKKLRKIIREELKQAS